MVAKAAAGTEGIRITGAESRPNVTLVTAAGLLGLAGGEAMLNIKVVTWSLALFGAVSFVVCVLYGLVVPESLHMTGFLEAVLPGFEWLTPIGFLIGLVESFLYGVYAGIVFAPIHNVLHGRWAVHGG